MRQATYSAEKSIRHNLIYFNVVKKKKKLPSVKNYNCIFSTTPNFIDRKIIHKIIRLRRNYIRFIFEKLQVREKEGRRDEGAGRWKVEGARVRADNRGENFRGCISPPPPPPLSLLLLSNVFGKKFGEEKGLDLTGKGNIYQGTG